jgi:hypothetical protein
MSIRIDIDGLDSLKRELESMIFDAVTSCKAESLSLEPFRSYIRQDESVAKAEATGQPDGASALKEKMESVSRMTEKG